MTDEERQDIGFGPADEVLRRFRPPSPSTAEVLAVRRAIAEETRGHRGPEVMTLGEVAAFLRIEENDLDRIVEDLPAFEFGGRLRVRRQRLIEWIERRERDYARATAAHAVAKGVA